MRSGKQHIGTQFGVQQINKYMATARQLTDHIRVQNNAHTVVKDSRWQHNNNLHEIHNIRINLSWHSLGILSLTDAGLAAEQIAVG